MFPSDSTCPMVLRIPLGCLNVSPTWLSHAPVDLPMSFNYKSVCVTFVHTPQILLPVVSPLPLSLATTRRISVDFFSSGYLDVSVPRVPHVTLWIHVTLHDYSSWGFPHSEICGSKLICSSPQLIAACHVLHRLLMPRHSPYALVRLNFLYNVSHYTMVLFELSEFLWTLRSGLLTLVRMKRLFYSPFALVLSYSTLRWNCIFPFRLERHII